MLIRPESRHLQSLREEREIAGDPIDSTVALEAGLVTERRIAYRRFYRPSSVMVPLCIRT
jgi:hypothetical protein